MEAEEKLIRFKSLTQSEAEVVFWRYYTNLTLSQIAEGKVYKKTQLVNDYFTSIFKTLLKGLSVKGDKWEAVKQEYGDIIEVELTNLLDVEKFRGRRKKIKPVVITPEPVIEIPEVIPEDEFGKDWISVKVNHTVPLNKVFRGSDGLVNAAQWLFSQLPGTLLDLIKHHAHNKKLSQKQRDSFVRHASLEIPAIFVEVYDEVSIWIIETLVYFGDTKGVCKTPEVILLPPDITWKYWD